MSIRHATRYAIGVGVALLMLHQQQLKDEKADRATDETMVRVAQQSAARGVLSVLPEYDKLAQELED